MNELAGQNLGGYYLEEEVGRGAMGVVYRGRQLVLEREVAIKVLPQSLARDASYVARFTREARIMADLNHPNIVQIYDAGRQNRHLYFVMEYVQGPTLANLLYLDGIIPPHLAIEYAAQIAEALDAAYRERNVIHRDIKPENLMLNRWGKIKVMDFGLARAPGLQVITVAQTLVGSIYYASPEQIWGITLDNRSDIYALGVVLYEMVCGRRPFIGRSMPELTQTIINGKLDPPRQFNPAISQALERIIMTALARDREQRYNDAELMAQELRALARLAPLPGEHYAQTTGAFRQPHPGQQFAQPPKRPLPQSPILLDVENIEHTKTQPLNNKIQQSRQMTDQPAPPQPTDSMPDINQKKTQGSSGEAPKTRKISTQPTVEMPRIEQSNHASAEREGEANAMSGEEQRSSPGRHLWEHIQKKRGKSASQ
ncbi:serine/threonine protein kinase [Ktedonobacteria bacterium brp13]|nr:serine/threonine protein kinase [Ktedonobacteria bacterium brp13]